jgi:hypothetical protein
MNRQDSPERMRDGGATDLERRLLRAAANEEPSPELRDRMAQAIGVSSGSPGGPADGAGSGGAATKAGTGASATTGSSGLATWISAGLLGLAVSGVIVGAHLWRTGDRHEAPAPVHVIAPPPAAAAAPAETVPRTAVESPTGSVAPTPPGRSAPPGRPGDLREQIALLDATRMAVSTGAGERALELLRQYKDRYPSGSFRPEAAALRVDALARLGRRAEARAEAEHFLAEFGKGPLGDRVARVAGLDRP